MRRLNKNTSGFTFIEVLLFLAISSFMILIAITSIGSRTSEVQFSDSIRGVESFIERRIALIESGSLVDDNSGCTYDDGPGYDLTQPSDGSCVFLGYMFEIGDYSASNPDPDVDQIFVYQMFGKRMTSGDLANCPDINELLACVEPIRVPENPVESYDIPWGVEVYTTINADIKAFGYFRNPAGQNIIPVAMYSSAESPATYEEAFDDDANYLTTSTDSDVAGEFATSICIRDDFRFAEIRLGNDGRQEAVEAVFNEVIQDETIACPAP